MLKTIIRYGTVLGVLLLLLEFLRRANTVGIVSTEFYLAIIAIGFLIGGFALAGSFIHLKSKRRRTAPASIRQTADLSARERDVLSYLVYGFSNAEIAQSLGVTQNTVKTHIKNLFIKLDVTNRTEAAAEAKMRGLLE